MINFAGLAVKIWQLLLTPTLSTGSKVGSVFLLSFELMDESVFLNFYFLVFLGSALNLVMGLSLSISRVVSHIQLSKTFLKFALYPNVSHTSDFAPELLWNSAIKLI